MKKTIRTLLILLVLAIAGYATFYFLTAKGVFPVNVIPGARTLYEGQVAIEPISLADTNAQLKAKNIYHSLDGEMLVVYPHGPGFGPLSFTLTENTLKASKDIPGTPDSEKYKEAVRQDVKDVGGIITIEENTWKITKTTYPWTVIY